MIPTMIPIVHMSGGGVRAVNYFGDGTEGAVTISTPTNITTTLDSGTGIVHYESLTVNSGQTLSVSNRCKAFVIYVQGDLVVNGTISMSSKGAQSASPIGTDTTISRWVDGGAGGGVPAHPLFSDEANQPVAGGGALTFTAFSVADSGGAGGSSGTSGTAGTGGAAGGGGSGGYSNGGSGGSGVPGYAYGGGSGGGGVGGGGPPNSTPGGNATNYGGAGGNGGNAYGPNPDANIWSGGGGGGAGNNGGSGGSAEPGNNGTATPGGTGSNGTGGVLYIIVGGDVTIGASGVIEADGTNGGNAGAMHPYSNPPAWPSGGGGSGGGSVFILHAGTYSNSGTVRANGGSGGSITTPRGITGGNGGAGSVTVQQVAL